MKRLFENVDGNQFRISEFSSIQPNNASSGNRDGIKEFLEIMANMPTDEPPTLQIWEAVVSGAQTALRIYLERNK